MMIYSVPSMHAWSGWFYDSSSWHAMVTGVNLGNMNAAKREVAVEVKRTVSGAMPLPWNGVRLRTAQVLDSNWQVIQPGLSELSFYGSEHPYEPDFNQNYFYSYTDDQVGSLT